MTPKLQGFNMYQSAIFNKLITEYKPETIIEVGTWLGGSAFTMCESIKANNLNAKLYCVDTWLGALEFIDPTLGMMDADRDLMLYKGYPQIYYQFLTNVKHTGNEGIIKPIPNTSAIASRYFKNNNIKAEIIYIDGSHDEEDVYSDLTNYLPLAEKVIFGDDYHLMGVGVAVGKFCVEKGLAFELFDNNFWIIRK
jgi:hypothetical protein